MYCKSGNFRENFIFANSFKRHIREAKNSRLRHDLHMSVNDRVISAFTRILFSRNFAYAKFCENKTLAKISEITVCFQNNTGLLVLNLAWNGFHTPGGNALAKALGKNTTLEELDISSNRIDDELLGTLASGLKKNSTLKILKVMGILICPSY